MHYCVHMSSGSVELDHQARMDKETKVFHMGDFSVTNHYFKVVVLPMSQLCTRL